MNSKPALILAAAIVALGVSAINACNWNDKGIILTFYIFN
jgi:hypothetical protein